MADAVQHDINDSRRVPNMVLTAHVHTYQRIERSIVKDTQTPFFILGACDGTADWRSVDCW